jgi:glycosyltransferase involved in cell wall biosynthesis
MRIGVLAPPWVSVPPPRYGGVETVVDSLARGYQAAGHDVLLFTVGDSTCAVPKLHLYDQAAEGDPAGSTVTELVHVLAGYEALSDCDLVHDHTIAGPLIAPGPVVTTAHCPLDGEGARLYGRMSRSAIIVAASEAQVVPGVPVARVIHHGIDPSGFSVGAGDGGYLLFLGKMTPEKGAHRALEAAFKSGQRLILAGKVREPAERWYFERYVAPYLNEPFGMVMLEAMASGTPVLAFDEGAAGEIVQDGRTGFLCTDEAHMAEVIGRVGELDRAACRAAVEDHFSAERMVAEYLELFSQLIFEPLKERPLKEFGDGGASTDVWSPSPSRRRK